jgi:predicted DNA-binding transcriptional regulator AlpA
MSLPVLGFVWSSDMGETGQPLDILEEWMSNQNYVKSCEAAGPPSSRLVDARTLGELLSMSRPQVWRLHRLGKIPVVKVGYRTHRYDIEAVIAALAGGES